ncbi:MAG TPA: NnrS family protein [Stellaceae bacterium]|nr:NnrS family protein [Stellaceae bacterium]
MPRFMSIEEPRHGRAARFSLFEYGFRVFFLLAGLYAALGVALWLPVFLGVLPLPVAVSATLWHAHEMIYGFAAAGVAGFFLTAVPNWTGAPARRGAPLMALAAIWLLARIAMLAMAWVPLWLPAALDLAFLPALAAAIAGPLWRSGAKRNLVLLAVLAALWAADLAMHLDFLGVAPDAGSRAARVGIDVLLLLITVIGGRIVPAFTTNALRAVDPALVARSFAPLDRATVLAMALLAASEAATGLGPVTGTIALVAAVLSAIRLSFWRGARTLGSPILSVLHLGCGWLVLGLALKGASAFMEAVPEAAALHALTAGAIATMLVAVMSRAALGHTGRPLKAHPATVSAYALISLAAALRVAAPFLPQVFVPLLETAAAAWTLAFLLFLAVYAPILTAPRADGRPG